MGCSSEPIHAHRGFGSLLRTEIWSIPRSAAPNAEEGGWVSLFIRSGILNMLAEGLGLIWGIPPSFIYLDLLNVMWIRRAGWTRATLAGP